MGTFGQHWEKQAFSGFQGLGTLSDYVEQHWPSLGNIGKNSCFRPFRGLVRCVTMLSNIGQVWATMGLLPQQWQKSDYSQSFTVLLGCATILRNDGRTVAQLWGQVEFSKPAQATP